MTMRFHRRHPEGSKNQLTPPGRLAAARRLDDRQGDLSSVPAYNEERIVDEQFVRIEQTGPLDRTLDALVPSGILRLFRISEDRERLVVARKRLVHLNSSRIHISARRLQFKEPPVPRIPGKDNQRRPRIWRRGQLHAQNRFLADFDNAGLESRILEQE